ncbi:MAG TPA: metal-sulfur cluster assembly factor [Anaerolineales bacterium]|nr:metal-sulfur cluster assembly factor [Anaerolineales bacterium]
MTPAQLARANASPEEQPLWSALEDVTDPEFPLSVVDMGLIYGLRREGEKVHLALTFTAMGCPCMDFILGDIRERLLQEPGVSQVEIAIVWDPPWTKSRLTAKGVERLRRCGVTV